MLSFFFNKRDNNVFLMLTLHYMRSGIGTWDTMSSQARANNVSLPFGLHTLLWLFILVIFYFQCSLEIMSLCILLRTILQLIAWRWKLMFTGNDQCHDFILQSQSHWVWDKKIKTWNYDFLNRSYINIIILSQSDNIIHLLINCILDWVQQIVHIITFTTIKLYHFEDCQKW